MHTCQLRFGARFNTLGAPCALTPGTWPQPERNSRFGTLCARWITRTRGSVQAHEASAAKRQPRTAQDASVSLLCSTLARCCTVVTAHCHPVVQTSGRSWDTWTTAAVETPLRVGFPITGGFTEPMCCHVPASAVPAVLSCPLVVSKQHWAGQSLQPVTGHSQTIVNARDNRFDSRLQGVVDDDAAAKHSVEMQCGSTSAITQLVFKPCAHSQQRWGTATPGHAAPVVSVRAHTCHGVAGAAAAASSVPGGRGRGRVARRHEHDQSARPRIPSPPAALAATACAALYLRALYGKYLSLPVVGQLAHDANHATAPRMRN